MRRWTSQLLMRIFPLRRSSVNMDELVRSSSQPAVVSTRGTERVHLSLYLSIHLPVPWTAFQLRQSLLLDSQSLSPEAGLKAHFGSVYNLQSESVNLDTVIGSVLVNRIQPPEIALCVGTRCTMSLSGTGRVVVVGGLIVVELLSIRICYTYICRQIKNQKNGHPSHRCYSRVK